MADNFELVKISELEEVTQANNLGEIPLSLQGEPRKISIANLRNDFLTDTTLKGSPTLQTSPTAGDDSKAIATTEWVQDELGTLGLNEATADTSGTVKTNSTVANPVVYVREEVDTLFNAVANEIQPISRGGTGANTTSQARSNLAAARNGVNNDILELTALTAIPTIVASAIAAATPLGVILPYGGSTAPTGYLLCEGQTVSRTTYSGLFAVIGTAYGVGNNTTTFQLPDLRGRSPLGAGIAVETGTQRELGTVGGAETHSLTTSEMPTHNHTGTTNADGSHTHSVPFRAAAAFASGGGTAHFLNGTSTSNSETGAVGNHTHTFSTANTGSGLPHNNMHPYQTVNFIIKAL